jgi:hypothetical protein
MLWLWLGISSTVSVCAASPPVYPGAILALLLPPCAPPSVAPSKNFPVILSQVPPKIIAGEVSLTEI